MPSSVPIDYEHMTVSDSDIDSDEEQTVIGALFLT